MKTKKTILCCIAAMLSLSSLMGCSQSDIPQAANELHFSLDDISKITISYDEEPITFHETDGDELVIQEYMTENKDSYHAKVKQGSGSIHISEGGKPFMKNGFSRYIEVYLPASYRKALTVTTTDGNVDLSDIELKLSALRIDSTAGTIQINDAAAAAIHLSSTSGSLDLGQIKADHIKLETTSGNIVCSELDGAVVYTSTSGNLKVTSAVGSGDYKANNSGSLEVSYTEVKGDLAFYNKNDDIQLTIPPNLEFQFESTTKNGSLSTTFQGNIRGEGRTVHGTVGDNPTITIKTETNNGNIQVNQKKTSEAGL